MATKHFSLKMAEGNTDPTAIILSFDSKWLDPIRSGAFSCVFRKMGPATFVPNLLYAYLARPVSAIVARMMVIGHREVSIAEAENLAPQAMLTSQAIRDYANKNLSLVVYDIGPMALARTPITLATLKDEYDFWPSSNYIPLAPHGTTLLDRLGNFTEGTSKHRPRE